ncbi:histidine phosphatase family protein [Undibacterium cyanobacteriorum]|uniref:Histidine phosphatase family protein n=1 Tax=Undibacterium cyanobacteriorum TaxID=3073561 RepID=A0ABY9RH08_9BURK|nr:histidine phosphatase family protein [Undibacterium sp. 20NA77.5]WMW80134.1 histidine phosphatase family protein [Undibacterium sp. 20NA77.5]
MNSIFLIRHGQASFDADDYDQLSPLGMEQSRLLGVWLRSMGYQPDHIVCGAAKRHRQTAQHCLQAWRQDLYQHPEQEWLIDAGFNEFDHEQVILQAHPRFTNFRELRHFVEQRAQPRRAFQELFTQAMQRWVSGEHQDYAESWSHFQQRCRAALQGACEREGQIWIFTSGGTISVLLQEILGISDAKIFDLNASLVNSGVSRLHYRTSRHDHTVRHISVASLNSAVHLEMHQAPALISYR